MKTIEEVARWVIAYAYDDLRVMDTLEEWRDDAIEAMEIFAAEMWDIKYEPDKMHCLIERWFHMSGDDLLRKHRGKLNKRPTILGASGEEPR